MVCEEILRGPQVTANGFVREGRVTMLGTVDSIMYPGTDQFQRFQYPSALPAAELARIDDLATRLVQGVGQRFDSQFDRPWRPGEPRASRLVFIGDHLDAAMLRRELQASLDAAATAA